jgi:hypothetical protein
VRSERIREIGANPVQGRRPLIRVERSKELIFKVPAAHEVQNYPILIGEAGQEGLIRPDQGRKQRDRDLEGPSLGRG